MQMISDYSLIIILWLIAILLIVLSIKVLNNFKSKDENNKDKKETLFFKVSIPFIILISSMDSSLSMKIDIEQKMLDSSIDSYTEEGFKIMSEDGDIDACQIPNSVIYLDNKGKITTEEDTYSVRLCI